MAVWFLLYVIAEVAAVWAVGSAVGVLATIGLLLAGALIGSWLARREGTRAAQAFFATAKAGRSPHNEVTDGMLIALGGLLILLPGFVSDVAGLLFLLPPSRAIVRRAWVRRLERRGALRPDAAFGHAGRMGQPRGVVIVDSEVVSEDRPQQQQQQQRPLIDPN